MRGVGVEEPVEEPSETPHVNEALWNPIASGSAVGGTNSAASSAFSANLSNSSV